MKHISFCFLFIFIVSVCFADDLFDILGTKYAYDFNEMTPEGFMSLAKGDGAGGAMERWTGVHNEIDIIFSGIKERARDDVWLFFMMDELHEKFYLDSIHVEFDGKLIILVENRKYYFPKDILNVKESHNAIRPYIMTNGELYWTRLEFLQPIDNKMDYPHVHFKKVFKGKKIGEHFPCKIIIKYRMDDGPQKIITYNYIVEVLKW